MTAQTKSTLVGWGKIAGVFLPMLLLFGSLTFKAGEHSTRLDSLGEEMENFEGRFNVRMDRMEDSVRADISSVRKLLQDHLRDGAKANGGGK